MAKEDGAPTAAEKGKGKMEDTKPSESPKKLDETKKDKDGKPIANGKPGDEPLEGIQSKYVSRCSFADPTCANRRTK